MPIKRNLLRGEITYSEAKEKETNIVQELTYPTSEANFKDQIQKKSATIKAVVAHHLHLNPNSCHVYVSDQSKWLNGSFNLCVPVSIQNQRQRCSRQVLMRFPLPYKTAESFRPGNGDEKIRCEAATYAWLNQECPSIPTSSLHGFGLSSGQKFTALQNAPVLTRCIQYLRRLILSLFRYPVPGQYMRHQSAALGELEIGYLLLDCIEDGKLLSQSYDEQSHDTTRKSNLFHDLAKIQLTLFQKPLPCIGSLSVDDDGILSVTNRPFTLEVCQLENEKIPIKASRNMTYPTVDTYLRYLLSLHDDRLRYQPNGASSLEDCISQMSALSTMRTISSHFFDCELQCGPFVLTLTDLHASNFFVDDDWHITNVIDLEWACVRPIEMQHPPYWLTSQVVDRVDEAQYSEICNEFMEIFQQEEKKMMNKELEKRAEDLFFTKLLKRLWERGTFWYCWALDSPTGLHHIFYNRIRPKYTAPDESAFEDSFYHVAPTFWSNDALDLMISKTKDKEKYDKQLRDAFQVSSL